MYGHLFSCAEGLASPRRASRPGRTAPKAQRSAGTHGDAARQRVRKKHANLKRAKRGFTPGAGKRVPLRTCVGCGETTEAEHLLRVILAPIALAGTGAEQGPRIVVDLSGKRSVDAKLGGRGAWVHARVSCIQGACTRGLSRAFKEPVQLTPAAFCALVRDAAERRLEGLVLAAWRTRRLVYGGDAVKEALPNSALGVLATDARAVAKESYVQEAGRQGKMLIWSTKDQLGKWLGRSEVGVMAVMDGAIADAMRRAIALASLDASAPAVVTEFAVVAETVDVEDETPGEDALRKDESSEDR